LHERRAHGLEEPPQEAPRVVGAPARVERGTARGERVHGRIARSDPRRRGLDDRQRAHEVQSARRGQQRDDAAVRMADEVVALSQPLRDEDGVLLEVHAFRRRVGREAWDGRG